MFFFIIEYSQKIYFCTFKKKLMKLYIYIFLGFFATIFLGCNTESRDESRAYVEGKISGTNLDFPLIRITLESDNKVIAEVIPENSGRFILSGPLLSESFSLGINKKIKSFSASKSGCILSADSKKILIPAGITYLIFNEIEVE